MPTLEEFKTLDWYNDRPEEIKNLINKFPYASSVLIKKTRQTAYVYSWFENGTLSVVIDVDENNHIQNALNENYRVFGLMPEDLEFLHENPDLIIDDGE